MKNKILIIITGIILLTAGYFWGSAIEKERLAFAYREIEEGEKIIKAINSLAIAHILGFGAVTDISDRKITLMHDDEYLEFYTGEDIPILSHVITRDEEGNVVDSEMKEVDFSNIKIGDELDVNLRIIIGEELEALSVTVLSEK
jgi:hypothetical protein